MKAAGISDEGIALVELLVEVLDERWPTRQEFIDHVNSLKVPLERKGLSKQLGSPAKPKGPDWHVAELIVRKSVPEQDVQAVLARAAALYCAARDVPIPPGYDGEVGRISPAPADQAEIEQLSQELAQRVEEVDALYAQVATLTAQGIHREEALRELAERNAALSSQVDTQEAEITRLSGVVMTASAQHARVQQQQRAQIEDQLRKLQEAETRIRDQQEQAEVSALRLRVLRDMYAQMVAQQEVTSPAPPLLPTPRGLSTVNTRPWMPRRLTRNSEPISLTPGASPASVSEAQLRARLDPVAAPPQRRLALYLLVHQEFSERGSRQLAAAAGLSHDQMDAVLTARVLPTAAQVDALAAALEADRALAASLHLEAVRSSPPGAASTMDQPLPGSGSSPPGRGRFDGPHGIGAYESIVAALGGEAAGDSTGAAAAVSPFVASSPGDSDTAAGDIGDATTTSGQALSPVRGDNSVTIGRDMGSRPIRRWNRWILRAVIAGGAVMSLTCTAIALALAYPAAHATIPLWIFAVGMGCWGIASGVRVAFRRLRGSYTARHRPVRRQAPQPAAGGAELASPLRLPDLEVGRPAGVAAGEAPTVVDQQVAAGPLSWAPVDLDTEPPRERAPGPRPSPRPRTVPALVPEERAAGVEPSPAAADIAPDTNSGEDAGSEAWADG